MEGWVEYGYLGLFISSMLAATIFPFYSEAVLGIMIIGKYDAVTCVLVASTGNWLGGMISYYMGYLGNWALIQKWLRVKKSFFNRWEPKLQKYGSFLALLCWAPVIGDPLAVALGFIRSNMVLVAIFMFTGKFIRYVILTWFILQGGVFD